SVPRSDAREYDKEGDRWDRHGKAFEYVCKACYKDLCRLPRDDLESIILDIEGAGLSQEAFVRRYLDRVEAVYGPIDDPDS
ncbi:MAG: DUF7562 family protein, partial [Halobacteriota archaeon]